MTIKAFIFDLDGVITDTAEFHFLAWKQLADEIGVSFTREDNDQLRGVSRRESLKRLLKGRPVDEATAEVWMQRKNDIYREFLHQITPADSLPGVVHFLDEARKRGILIGLGSASKNARDVIERLKLMDYFEALGDGYSVVNPKPAPDLFIWVAGRLGVPPNEAVVFEDAEAGVDAALKGGFWTVGLGRAGVNAAHLVKEDGLKTLTVDAVLEVASG
ncbi:MAG TPA: beta-phosphoglucomutase [Aggregatilineales bacterium]|nr:beta-phosphoglucomutase [Anaerolineae bacterium]HUN09578.1 beta-phosphoglucomutase [Aggregatilineales bacterium]